MNNAVIVTAEAFSVIPNQGPNNDLTHMQTLKFMVPLEVVKEIEAAFKSKMTASGDSLKFQISLPDSDAPVESYDTTEDALANLLFDEYEYDQTEENINVVLKWLLGAGRELGYQGIARVASRR